MINRASAAGICSHFNKEKEPLSVEIGPHIDIIVVWVEFGSSRHAATRSTSLPSSSQVT